MTLYEQIKDALKRGLPPEQIAAFFGVSVYLVKKTQELIKELEGPNNDP